MKNATIRIVLILALLSAAGIIATQVFWVRRAYNLADREFNLNVNNALRNVATQIWEIKQIQPLVYDVVRRVNPNYYTVQINDRIDHNILEHLLREEFEKRNIITDFAYGIYDCMKDTVIVHKFVYANSGKDSFKAVQNWPKLHRENYYFGVYFPHRNIYASKQLSIWFLSSFILLGILLFLGYVVSVVLRQKRLGEVQKDFVNNMAHEFKTPLASIQLAAEVLSKPEIVNKPERLLSYATIIDNEAAQLVSQIERVLQMAHSEKGMVSLQKQNLNLQELIKHTVSLFQGRLHSKNAILNVEVPEEPVMIDADKLHLGNALSNLFDNALKYSSENPVIDVRLEKTKDEIRIIVKDNGIGVDEEHKKLIFKKFYRVPTGNIHDVKGFGLGLNYVQLTVEAHGGRVFCESEKDVGSTFYIIFPVK